MNLIKPIQDYIQKKRAIKTQLRYYKILQMGGKFITFIQKDIDNMKEKQINRHMRRRFEKALKDQGKLSPEMIYHYYNKINEIIKHLESK